MNVILAYVDADKWIAECPECKWAIHIQQGFTDFLCGRFPNGRLVTTGCGYEARVQWPAEINEIETVLKQRPKAMRNYHPHDGDTLAVLRIENASIGLPSGLDGAA